MIPQPYYAVIFTSKKNPDIKGYQELSTQMEYLAKSQPGFIGIDSAQSELGITISYWKTLEDIQNWKNNPKHLLAQHLGKSEFYQWYSVRVVKVEREYEFGEL